MENNNQSSFWQFSDQLRVQSNNLANLSLNDSIWSTSYGSKRPEKDRRNFDIRVGGDFINSGAGNANSSGSSNSDFNGFNFDWKMGPTSQNHHVGDFGINGGFNKGIYSKPSLNFGVNNFNNHNNVGFEKNGFKKDGKFGKNGEDDHHGFGGKHGKNKKNNNNSNVNNNTNEKDKNSVDKRFKTLPPSESLPRNETVGGYIFVCNNDTMQENLKRQLFGLPPRYRDSVRQITPGLPLFLYNYSTHQLHGVFEATSFGGTNIDPSAWEDKKNPGESRFPAQVRVMTRKLAEPLEEDSFRPILHHYDGPKFRLELNIPEALSLLDIFEDNKN
ncbi:putative development/cell death domain-containing protein [Helianthus annuus]|uniref:Development/cell death domain-containing protein n=1 Tax=Helianthus annuus TaxID=4232 RepID=A0A251SUZ9_HELAN|nr:B2 protein [Helianthus annuus]KAF5774721.1 putative development/cell death domain-containing protein [Helianthus annuus]KAJ0478013.1 putative DCD domain-containing protein NRP [Helianthus annuus]KAJ0482632.1 putative development/cell death domain-containing protein [Helianthus annuus]KAJ0498870.1 putative DCD domain-containing protein NRP [Helianthus annuus]KAJ0664885.1 putative DCD domain-containing protein NRP [Helianthus annuus]